MENQFTPAQALFPVGNPLVQVWDQPGKKRARRFFAINTLASIRCFIRISRDMVIGGAASAGLQFRLLIPNHEKYLSSNRSSENHRVTRFGGIP